MILFLYIFCCLNHFIYMYLNIQSGEYTKKASKIKPIDLQEWNHLVKQTKKCRRAV